MGEMESSSPRLFTLSALMPIVKVGGMYLQFIKSHCLLRPVSHLRCGPYIVNGRCAVLHRLCSIQTKLYIYNLAIRQEEGREGGKRGKKLLRKDRQKFTAREI